MIDSELVVGTATNILISSAMYILAALGFAFVWNMMGILNLAHGAIYMIGGYVTYLFAVTIGINQWLALIITVVLFAGLGMLLEKYCFRPFVGDFDSAVVVCVGVSVIMQQSVNIMIGTKVMSIPDFVSGIFSAGLISISYERIVIFAVGAAFTIFVLWFVWNTKLGQQMQAISQNRKAAFLQGIDVNRVQGVACAMGCALAAVAGTMVAAFTNLGPFMGDAMLLRVIMLVILAGAGSIGGVIIGGVLLGIMNGILPVAFSAEVADVVYVGVIVILLFIRPQGLFGHEVT